MEEPEEWRHLRPALHRQAEGVDEGIADADRPLGRSELVLSSHAVYEGLFKLSGTIGGKAVAGQAWGEIQPAGKL